MKSYFTAFILTVFFLAATFTMSFSQDWDNQVVGIPSVLFIDGTYHMWYTGNSPLPAGGIGYASSNDGINWEKYPGNPVLINEPTDEWKEAATYESNVIYDGTLFHMWYSSTQDPLFQSTILIHHATSTDGIFWSKDTLNNPVLRPGAAGSWDDFFVDSHCIIFTDGTYHMWYMGWNGTADQVRIGHAISDDGVNWTKDSNNPVLSYGTPGSWDYPRVEAPNVIFAGNMFHMWYSGGDHSEWQIGYATSVDGVTWVKYTENPVLKIGSSGSWDDQWVGFVSVLWDSDSSNYKMWYSGGDQYLLNQNPWRIVSQIGYATSSDGINWDKNPDPVVTEIGEIKHNILDGYSLSQNYPNPFNPTTNIEFSIPKSEFVTLKIYNLLGQEVETLVSETLHMGSYSYSWDAGTLASGVYLYKLQAGDFVQTRKMVLLR